MITDRIKALFNFIEFLYSNIDNFKRYDTLISELYFWGIERNKIKPQNNFEDKLKYDNIQKIIKDKFNVIQSNIILPIQDKSSELNICDWNKTETLWNYNIKEIDDLKKNFSKNDIPEILKHKSKYLEFRTKTNCNYFQTFFFSDLDEILKVIFDFFKESYEDEFEAFETKTIKVNDISKYIELHSKGYKEYKIEVNKNYNLPNLSNSIFDLTLQNLVDYGLSEEDSSKLLKVKEEYKLQCNEGVFFVSGKEKKVYTGIEFYRKTCFDNDKILFPFNCSDLIPEYFDLALNEFKQEQNKLLGKIYNDSDAFFEFINNEINKMENRIEAQKEFVLKMKHHKSKSKENDIKVCKAYIQFLERKKDKIKEPQQIENYKPDEGKSTHPKHDPNYWNKDCFDLFKYLFDEYYKGTIRQITNIWFYLNEFDRSNNKRKYVLKATKNDYKIFINENYNITIKNFDKARQKYEDKEVNTLNEHRINYEDSLK